MKSYLLSVLAVSLAASLLFHLLPKKATFKKGVKFLSALLLLLLLFSPLLSIKESIAGFFFGERFLIQSDFESSYEEKSRQSLLSYSKDYLEELIKSRLVSEFSLRNEDLSVRVRFEGEEPKQVFLILSGKAIWQDSAKMEAFAEELLGLPCSSVIE